MLIFMFPSQSHLWLYLYWVALYWLGVEPEAGTCYYQFLHISGMNEVANLIALAKAKA